VALACLPIGLYACNSVIHVLDRFEDAGPVEVQDNWSSVQCMLSRADLGYQAIIATVDDARGAAAPAGREYSLGRHNEWHQGESRGISGGLGNGTIAGLPLVLQLCTCSHVH
jgi:hypothetical protein